MVLLFGITLSLRGHRWGEFWYDMFFVLVWVFWLVWSFLLFYCWLAAFFQLWNGFKISQDYYFLLKWLREAKRFGNLSFSSSLTVVSLLEGSDLQIISSVNWAEKVPWLQLTLFFLDLPHKRLVLLWLTGQFRRVMSKDGYPWAVNQISLWQHSLPIFEGVILIVSDSWWRRIIAMDSSCASWYKPGDSNRCLKKKWTSEVHSLNGNQCASSFIRRLFSNGFCLCRVGWKPDIIACCNRKKCKLKVNLLLVVFFISEHLCSETSFQTFWLSTFYCSLCMQ